MNIVYLNNSRVSPESKISLFNASFLYGINVFEGIRGYWCENTNKIIIFDLDLHLNRLYESMNLINFIAPLKKESLKDELLKIITDENIKENIYIRITFFIDGDTSWSEREFIGRIISIRSIVSNLSNLSNLSDSINTHSLFISSFKRISYDSMPPFVKAGANYLNSRYALLEAQSKGFDGALFLNHQGNISESTGSCIFFIKNNIVYTPSIDCDILVGITRNRIINICKLYDIQLIEKKILLDELNQFECAFLAGTMIEIKPIKKINDLYFNLDNKVLNLICKKLTDYVYGLEI